MNFASLSQLFSATAVSSGVVNSQYMTNSATQNQNQLSQQELAQKAAQARAKRLQSLFDQFSDLLQHAVLEDDDPLAALELSEQYVTYVLSRLAGDTTAMPPEGFDEFADELESLVDDIMMAWDALIKAGDFSKSENPDDALTSIQQIVDMLERIAQRRFERMLANDWYFKWRMLYRDKITDAEQTGLEAANQLACSLPMGVSPGEAQAQVLATGSTVPQTSQLMRLLNHALEIKRPDGTPLLSQEKHQQLTGFLANVGHLTRPAEV